MRNDHKLILSATFFVVLSGILYGFLGFLGTSILRENISISTMLFWRFFIAGSWILLFVIKKYSTQPVLDPINKRTSLFMFLLGAIGYAGSSGFYFIASQYTGTGLAMVIFFSYPIIIALTSWTIHRQNFNVGTFLTLIAITIGLFLLQNSTTHQMDILGIFFGVISAACYAFYVMGSKRISSINIDPNVLTMLVCFACSFVFLILSISSHSFIFPHSVQSWIFLVALGVVVTAFPIQLMLKGLKYISSMRASIISVLEPLITVFVGVLLLDESISHLQILGVFIILGSALLVQFQKKL